MQVYRNAVVAIIMALLILPVSAQAAIWQDLTEVELAAKGAAAQPPVYYRALRANRAELGLVLLTAPLEDTSSQGVILELPMPDGTMQQFEVVNSPILSPGLAASHPDIATYAVRGIDNPLITGRLDLTPVGFHAMLSTPAGTVFINPDDNDNYRSFYKKDFIPDSEVPISDRRCHLGGEAIEASSLTAASSKYAARTVSSAYRRIYRLAVTTTSGYSEYFGNSQAVIFSNVVTAINRVNQIYARDLGVLLQLNFVLANINVDTFSGISVSAALAKNQEILDAEFGVDAYDLGHVFGITGGGLAQLGAACTSLKAHGFSGYAAPDNDIFYIDLLAHELGHQLSATHSFNGTTQSCVNPNRTAISAVEPGSGSTIMAYAGICGGENLQSNSDAVFHAFNIDKVNNYVFAGSGSSCGTLVSTFNSMPVVDAGATVTIPQGTPFSLTINELTDPNGDTLSYQWDQMDANGTATTAATFGQDLGNNPLFRSFVPTNTPTRYFPRLSTLLSGISDPAETLPTTDRNLNFRLTVRDGNSGVAVDDLVVNVDQGMGPFMINSVVQGSGSLTVDWDPADTSLFCPSLNVSLVAFSSDGSTFCDAGDNSDLDLATVVNANGGGTVNFSPSTPSVTRARLKLSCATGIFFALSDTDLSISTANPQAASDCKAIDGATIAHGSVSIDPATGGVSQGGVKSSGGGGALFLLVLLLFTTSLANRSRIAVR
jgi:hypothetical protein